MHVETEIEIDAPAERVWAILTDISRWPEWNPMMTVRGELVVGARLRLGLRLGKFTLPATAEVDTVEPNREIAWTGLAPRWTRRLMHGTHYFRIEPLSDERVRFVHGERFGGPLAPRDGGRAEANVTKIYASLNRALKSRAEG